MTRIARLALVLLVSVPLFLAGCSKKETPAAGAARGLPQSELLDRVPTTTVAFVFQETHSAAYQAYAASAWATQSDSYTSKILELSKDVPELQKFARIAQNTPFFKNAAGAPRAPRESVLFATRVGDWQGAAIPLGFGFFAELTEQIDPQASLTAFEAALKAEQVPVKREPVGGLEGLVVTLTFPSSNGGETSSNPLFVVATANRVGFASTPAVLERLLVPLDSIGTAERGSTALGAKPVYQRVRARAETVGGIFAFGFVDAGTLVAGLSKQLEPVAPEVAAAGLEDTVESASFVRAMNDGLNDYVWLGFAEGALRPETATHLTSGGKHPGVARAPAGSVFVTSIDGGLLKVAKAHALASTAGQPPPPAPLLDQLDKIEGIGLAVRNASGASPFPELIFTIHSTDAAALKEQLKAVIGVASAGQGLPVTGWQTKTVGALSVDFMASPLGLGAYLGVTDGAVVVATSEGVFNDIERGNFAKEVGERFTHRAFTDDRAPIVLGYLSGQRLAAMVESLQASLAMFTGGQNMVDAATIQSLRSLGSIAMALTYNSGALRLHHQYEVEQPAA